MSRFPEHDELRAEGRAAFEAGKRLADNPYGQSTGYSSFYWASGFRQARTAKMKAKEAK